MRLGRARKTMIYLSRLRNSQIEHSAAQQIVSRLLRQSSQKDMGLELPPLHDGGPSPVQKKTPEVTKQSDHIQLMPRRASTEGSSLKSSVQVKKRKVSTHTLFAIVIYDEFLRELAALSQEHSVLNPSLIYPSL